MFQILKNKTFVKDVREQLSSDSVINIFIPYIYTSAPPSKMRKCTKINYSHNSTQQVWETSGMHHSRVITTIILQTQKQPFADVLQNACS